MEIVYQKKVPEFGQRVLFRTNRNRKNIIDTRELQAKDLIIHNRLQFNKLA